VTILLGNGSGGFTAAAGNPIGLGGQGLSVAVGDFNGDGIQDLVAAVAPGSIAVLLGNGLGGFSAAPNSPFATGSLPLSVAVGDFNGDRIPDVATANFDSDNVTVLLGNGSGGFTAAPGSPFAAGTLPNFMVAGDFNGDGVEDLVVADLKGNNVTVLLGSGSGGFTAAPASPLGTGRFPISVAVGDFNGDGIEDVVVADAGKNNLTVLVGTRVGNAPQTIAFGTLSNVDITYGVAPFAISATSTSGLAVSFASSTPFVCTITSGTVSVFGTGTCTIIASQAGNATYAAAATVPQSFTVSVVTPVATTVTPNSAPIHSGATPVTIAGTNFGTSATVQFTPPGGTPHTISPDTIAAGRLRPRFLQRF
jgi:hypothetical protein